MYASVPFLETLKGALTYLKFLGQLLSKKGETKDTLVAPVGELGLTEQVTVKAAGS